MYELNIVPNYPGDELTVVDSTHKILLKLN